MKTSVIFATIVTGLWLLKTGRLTRIYATITR